MHSHMIDKAFFELNPARSVIAIAGDDRAEKGKEDDGRVHEPVNPSSN